MSKHYHDTQSESREETSMKIELSRVPWRCVTVTETFLLQSSLNEVEFLYNTYTVYNRESYRFHQWHQELNQCSHRTTVECLTGWCCPALLPAFCFSTGDARSSPHVCLQIITTAYTRKPPCCWVLKPTPHWRHSAASNDELCFFSPLFLLDSLGDTGTGDYCFPYECIPREYYGFQIGSLNIGMQLDVVTWM